MGVVSADVPAPPPRDIDLPSYDHRIYNFETMMEVNRQLGRLEGKIDSLSSSILEVKKVNTKTDQRLRVIEVGIGLATGAGLLIFWFLDPIVQSLTAGIADQLGGQIAEQIMHNKAE